MNIDAYLANLVDAVEGPAYTNHPADRGGPTRWGITQKTLAQHCGKPVTADEVRLLARDEALAIYRADYVALPGFDQLAAISGPVALKCIDAGVNMGPKVAAQTLQRCLNALGSELKVDGQAGPATRTALQALLKLRGPTGERVLLVMLNCAQGARYLDIAEADPTQRAFVFGWFRQRIQLVPDPAFYGSV